MIVDKLFDAVAMRGPVCVGLDTAIEYLPLEFRAGFDDPGEALFQFNRRIVDATTASCACFKLQIAYYEALGLEGLRAYARTLRYIRAKGCIAPGYDGDLVLVDLHTPWTVDATAFASKGRNTPFEGRTLVGRVIITIKAGRIVYDDTTSNQEARQ